MRTKTTIYIDDVVLRAARLLAAREGKEENEIFEEAIRRHLGLDVLNDVWARSDYRRMRLWRWRTRNSIGRGTASARCTG